MSYAQNGKKIKCGDCAHFVKDGKCGFFTTPAGYAKDRPFGYAPFWVWSDCYSDKEQVRANVETTCSTFAPKEKGACSMSLTSTPAAPVSTDEAYNQIDRFLRNNLDDDAYASHSAALDVVLFAAASVAPASQIAEIIKYVPVDSKLRNDNWNHPNDKEPRTAACSKALNDRGDNTGQGLDGYWKWGFTTGWNAAIAQHAPVAPAVPEGDKPLKVTVCHIGVGDDPFVFIINGRATAEVITQINHDLNEDLDLFDQGPGDYEFDVTYEAAQYGFEGRMELKGGWMFDKKSFAAMQATGAAT